MVPERMWWGSWVEKITVVGQDRDKWKRVGDDDVYVGEKTVLTMQRTGCGVEILNKIL